MSREKLLGWLRDGIRSLRDDVYLLEKGANERCVTAKLGCHLHQHLPSLVGEANAKRPSEERFHVDCEYDIFGDDTKWFPWDVPVVDAVTKEIYYTPQPDIILHRRGVGVPNVLVIEAKRADRVNDFTALIDRMKLIGYLGPNMNYRYGLYLSLGHAGGKLVIATAELIEFEPVREAKKGKGAKAWTDASKHVEDELDDCGKVKFCKHPNAKTIAEAGKLCVELVEKFSFTDVRANL